MAISTSRRFKGKVRDDYLDLIIKFPLTSIRSDDDLAAAQEVMDRLLAKGDLSTGEQLYLDALSDLVAAYEDDHHVIPPRVGCRHAETSYGSEGRESDRVAPEHQASEVHHLGDSER